MPIREKFAGYYTLLDKSYFITELNSKSKSIFNPAKIPNSSDLNDYTDYGFYYWSGTTILQNSPFSAYNAQGGMIVIRTAGSELVQIIFTAYQSSIYIRFMSTSGWGAWRKFAIQDISV